MNDVLKSLEEGDFSYRGNANYVSVYNKYFTLSLRKDRVFSYVTQYCSVTFRNAYDGMFKEEIKAAYKALLKVTDMVDSVIFGGDGEPEGKTYVLPHQDGPKPLFKNNGDIQPYVFKGYSLEQLVFIDKCITKRLDVKYLLEVEDSRVPEIDTRYIYHLESMGISAKKIAMLPFSRKQQDVLYEGYSRGLCADICADPKYSAKYMERVLSALDWNINLIVFTNTVSSMSIKRRVYEAIDLGNFDKTMALVTKYCKRSFLCR